MNNRVRHEQNLSFDTTHFWQDLLIFYCDILCIILSSHRSVLPVLVSLLVPAREISQRNVITYNKNRGRNIWFIITLSIYYHLFTNIFNTKRCFHICMIGATWFWQTICDQRISLVWYINQFLIYIFWYFVWL